jgi:hypothetical protein
METLINLESLNPGVLVRMVHRSILDYGHCGQEIAFLKR